MRASDSVTLNVWHEIMKTFTVIHSFVANLLAFSAGWRFLSFSLVLPFLSFLSPSLLTVSLCGVNRFPCCFKALSGLWLELVIQLNTCTQSTIHSPAVFKTGSTHLLLQQYNTLSSTTPGSLNFLAQHLLPCAYSWFPPQSSCQFGLENSPLRTSPLARLTPGETICHLGLCIYLSTLALYFWVHRFLCS